MWIVCLFEHAYRLRGGRTETKKILVWFTQYLLSNNVPNTQPGGIGKMGWVSVPWIVYSSGKWWRAIGHWAAVQDASATTGRAKQCHLRPGLTYSWQANGQRKVTSNAWISCLCVLSVCEGMENEQRQSGMGCCASLWWFRQSGAVRSHRWNRQKRMRLSLRLAS